MATNLLLGVKDAVVGTVDGLIDGIKYAWNNPLQTIEGVTFFSRALHSGIEENDLLVQMIEESGKKLSTEFIEGDADKKARMLGQAVGEVLLALVSTKGVTAAVDAIKAGIKSGELASWFSKFSKGTATAEDIANGLGKTAETVDKADDSVKIIGNIEDSEIGIKGGSNSSKLDWDSVVSKKGETRINHINKHGVDNLGRDTHTVFNDDPITTTNKAWENKGNTSPIDDGMGREIYNIPYKNSGYEGGAMGSGNN